MGNIIDYVREHGDISFLQEPLNEVDSLVLCQMVYMNFGRFVPGLEERNQLISIQDIYHHPDRDHLLDDYWYKQYNKELFEAAADSRRFGTLKMNYYVNVINVDDETQFSAITYILENKETYIAYRGTDATIIGWKEDLNLAFSKPLSSQHLSVAYMDKVSSWIAGSFYAGGHSKGGNLAMYTAMQCDDALQEKILSVYDNDGPGFPEAFFSSEKVEKVLPKVTRIIPEASVIGMLLNHQKDPLIVASTQKGILQHDAFTWEVMGPSFIEKESLTRRAAASDRSLHKWIDHMDERQREHLIGELFSVLEATGAETISQIQDGGLKSLAAMVRQLDKLEPRSKIMVQELIAGIFGSWLELLPLPELDKKRFLP